MKKLLFVIIPIIVLVITFLLAYPKPTAVCDDFNGVSAIVYGNTTYLDWLDINQHYRNMGAIDKNATSMEPYYCLCDGFPETLKDKIYISYGNTLGDLIPPYRYFSTSVENDAFIFVCPDDSSLNLTYIKKDFVFPTANNNEVDEIWMSVNKNDESNIKDSETIEYIVNCIKDNKNLSEDVCKYITEKSYDNCSIYLKYKGYPLLEQYTVARNGEVKRWDSNYESID